MVQHLTLLSWATQSRPVAGVDTSSHLASLIARTLGITPAFHLAIRTGENSLLVDQEAVLALAHRLVKVHLALLVGVTGESGAGIHTLLVSSVAGLS